MQKGSQMPKHSNAGGGVKSRPESAVKSYPKHINTSGMRSDQHAKDDDRWSIAQMHDKMRKEAHSKNLDRSGQRGVTGYDDGPSIKGGGK